MKLNLIIADTKTEMKDVKQSENMKVLNRQSWKNETNWNNLFYLIW